MRPSIASMLARLASRSRAFHAPQKTPSTWCDIICRGIGIGDFGRAPRPHGSLLYSALSGAAARPECAAQPSPWGVSPGRPGQCTAAPPPRRHAGLATCRGTRRSLSSARLSGSLGMAALGAAPPLANPTTRKRPPQPRARKATWDRGLGLGSGSGLGFSHLGQREHARMHAWGRSLCCM
eukprot:scaffold32155_cov102-Phaeocystis_antarctica.AAC.1